MLNKKQLRAKKKNNKDWKADIILFRKAQQKHGKDIPIFVLAFRNSAWNIFAVHLYRLREYLLSLSFVNINHDQIIDNACC